MLQSTARSATTVSTSARSMSKRNAYGSPAYGAHLAGGEVDEDLDVAGAQQARRRRRPARSVGAIASSGSHHSCSVGERSVVGVRRPRRLAARRATAASRPGSSARYVALVGRRSRRPRRRRTDGVTVDAVRRDLDRRARDRQDAVRARTRRGGRGTRAGRGRCSARRRRSTLRWNSSGSRKHGGPALGTTARASIAST